MDAGHRVQAAPQRRTIRSWLPILLYVGCTGLTIVVLALPMYAPDHAASLQLQHIASSLGIIGLLCFLFFSLLILPQRPTKRSLTSVCWVLASAELALTVTALTLTFIAPTAGAQLSNVLLEIATIVLWAIVIPTFVIWGAGLANLMRAQQQAASAAPISDVAINANTPNAHPPEIPHAGE